MRKLNRFLAVAIVVTLLVPGFVVGALVQACCGVDVTDLQVADAPDPVCLEDAVTISGTYVAYSEWSGQYPVSPYDTGINIKIFNSAMALVDELDQQLGTAEPDPGNYPPGTPWTFSQDWTPQEAGAYTYEVIAWSETNWGKMETSVVSGSFTVLEGQCLDCVLETEIRDRWEAECPSCDEAKNHGAYVGCRADIQNEYLMAGQITAEESSCLMNPEARTDCGKQGP